MVNALVDEVLADLEPLAQGKKYKTYWKMHGYKDDRK